MNQSRAWHGIYVSIVSIFCTWLAMHYEYCMTIFNGIKTCIHMYQATDCSSLAVVDHLSEGPWLDPRYIQASLSKILNHCECVSLVKGPYKNHWLCHSPLVNANTKYKWWRKESRVQQQWGWELYSLVFDTVQSWLSTVCRNRHCDSKCSFQFILRYFSHTNVCGHGVTKFGDLCLSVDDPASCRKSTNST